MDSSNSYYATRETYLKGRSNARGHRGSVSRWIRRLEIYSPGIILFTAGILALTSIPIVQHSPTCSCPRGGTCSCPAETTTFDLTAPYLLLGSAVYSLGALVVSRRWHTRRGARPGDPESV